MKKKSKVKKVITSLVAVSVSVGALLGAYKIYNTLEENGFINPNNQQQNLVLDDVKNISFDEEKNLFSWNAVENADSYVASVNGVESTVDSNYFYYIPTFNETEFKVKAVDSTGEYKESNWSDVYTYSVSKEEVTYSSIYGFVNGMLVGDYKLQKILSLEIEDGVLYTKASYLDVENQPKLFYLRTKFGENKYDSLFEMINHQDEGFTIITERYDLCEQEAMEYLLKSNSFTGPLEEYRKDGYEISVVSSKSGLVENYGVIELEGTLKLEKNGDVKYATASFECIVINPTGNPKLDYTVKLADPETRIMGTINFKILTGDLVTFAEEVERVNSLQQENESSIVDTKTYTYDFNGLEV